MAQKFEIRRGDKRLNTPGGWDYPTARAIFAREGVDPSLCPVKISGYSEIIPGQNGKRGFAIYPVIEFAPERTNTQGFYGQDVYFEEQKVTYVHKVIELELSGVKQKLTNMLSKIHDADLLGRVEWRGMLIKFDQEAKTNVLGYLTEFNMNGPSSVEWRGKAIETKDEEGNVTAVGHNVVTISTMEAMGELSMVISGRVKASYAARTLVEKQIDELIEAGDRDAINAVDFKQAYLDKIAELLTN